MRINQDNLEEVLRDLLDPGVAARMIFDATDDDDAINFARYILRRFGYQIIDDS